MRTKKKAFTLIEVMIAVFVVGICAIIVAATMPIATVSRGKADLLNKATGLAQKQLEQIKGLGYANANATQLASYGLIDSATPVTGTTYSFTNSDNSNNDNPALVLPSGIGRINIQQIDVDLVQITVSVTYTDTAQYSRTVNIGTVIANL